MVNDQLIEPNVCSLEKNLSILYLIEEYNNHHSRASDLLKLSFWNICKARRHRGAHHLVGSTSFTAEDVREELSASASVSKITNDSISNSVQDFHLDLCSNSSNNKDGKARVESVLICEDHNNASKTGLRNRRGGSEPEGDCAVGNIIEERVALDDEPASDPIDLFGGFPPNDLRTAQTNAREALQLYVDAANLQQEIQERIRRELQNVH